MNVAAVPSHYLGNVAYMPQQTASGDPTMAASSSRKQVIDGTPSRVAAIGILSLALVVGFRYSGFKFNVAVGN